MSPPEAAVRIEVTKGRETLTITNLDKLEEPDSYLLLKQQVEALLPHVDLPEVLLEIQVKTGFMDEFIHINESFARVRDLSTSICAVLIASACNIGLTPLVRPDVPALTRPRLTWVEQNYIRPETLVRANARLVDAQAQIPLAQNWGGGEVASADGLRFIVPVRTLNAGLNSKSSMTHKKHGLKTSVCKAFSLSVSFCTIATQTPSLLKRFVNVQYLELAARRTYEHIRG